MKRVYIMTILLVACAQLASSQIRLEVTGDSKDKDGRRATMWAKGCDARIDDTDDAKVYMLLKDCGKTIIAVSVEDKAALKIPPMQSSPAPDLNTGALFMQGKPQITVEKMEEKPGEKILGRATTYYRFRSVQRPDPRFQEPVKLIVEEEFWTDPTLNLPVLEGMLGKASFGEGHENQRAAFAAMKGLPLRHRTVVTVERAGARQSEAAFVQEIVSISTEPFDENLLQIPKGFPLVENSGRYDRARFWNPPP